MQKYTQVMALLGVPGMVDDINTWISWLDAYVQWMPRGMGTALVIGSLVWWYFLNKKEKQKTANDLIALKASVKDPDVYKRLEALEVKIVGLRPSGPSASGRLTVRANPWQHPIRWVKQTWRERKE